MQQSTVKFLIGGPNSGKTTWIKTMINPACDQLDIPQPTVVSYNRVRKQFASACGICYMDTFVDTHNDEIDARFFTALDAALQRPGNIVINHPYASLRERAAIIEHVRDVRPDDRIEALWFELSSNEAIARNEGRTAALKASGRADCVLSDEHIQESYKRLARPSEAEGFDVVRTAPPCVLHYQPGHRKHAGKTTGAVTASF